MGGIRTMGIAALRRIGAFGGRFARTVDSTRGNGGGSVTLGVGLFSLVVIWLGVGYIANEDYHRTESTTFQDTANLARAFEEHIIRLIQAHDQILLFVRASVAKDPQHFDLTSWALEQQFATEVTLQLAT